MEDNNSGPPGSKSDEPKRSLYATMPNEILDMVVAGLGVSDIKSLVATCRAYQQGLQTTLLRRDIEDRQYNSMAWACYFGKQELLRACLDAGASPNAVFCIDRPRTPQTHETVGKDYRLFEIPVFPYKRVCGRQLFPPDQALSALSLATKRNNLAIMQILLDSGAETFERQIRLTDLPAGLTQDPFVFRHFRPVIRHVRSVEAAKILLAAGADPDPGSTGSRRVPPDTPLEMLLLNFGASIDVGNFEVTEAEFCSIIQLFLDHIATSRNTARLANIPGANNSYTRSWSLQAAIRSRCLGAFKLFLKPEQIDPSDINEVCEKAFYIGLGAGELEILDDFRNKILVATLEAGFPPNGRVILPWTSTRPLSVAIANHNCLAVRTLVAWNVDIDAVPVRDLSPLSLAVCQCHLHLKRGVSLRGKKLDKHFIEGREKNRNMVEELLRLGASTNQPSLFSEGFPPLMFAACHGIEAPIFELILQHGAERTGFYKLEPKSQSVSVMQLIFGGFYLEQLIGATFDRPSQTRTLSLDLDEIRSHSEYRLHVRHNTAAKFASFISVGLDKSHFQTVHGQHILNWAIENLRGFDLDCAFELLHPYYHKTTLPSDKEHPLFSLFSLHRQRSYLAFSTLDQTAHMVADILMKDPTITCNEKLNGETVLHRVCKLQCGLPGRGHWEAFDEDDYSQFIDISDKFPRRAFRRCVGPGVLDFTRLMFEDLEHLEESYVHERKLKLTEIMAALQARGANLYVRDNNGKTAYEYAKENNILQCIQLSRRDMAKEERIERARDY